MLKKLLLTAMLGAASIGAHAVMVESQFSYVEEQLVAQNPSYINATGFNTVEAYQVCMRINEPAMAGTQITAITAYVNVSPENAKDFKLWGSTRLEDENFRPNIFSVSVTPQPVNLYGEDVWKLTYELDTPYELTGEIVYFGYSLEVTHVSSDPVMGYPGRWPVLTSKANLTTPAGLWMWSSESYPQWSNNYYNYGVAWIILDTQRDAQPYAINLISSEDAQAAINTPYETRFTISNPGLNPVSSLTYSFAIDDGEWTENTLQFDTPIQPSMEQYYILTLPFPPIEDEGEHLVDIRFTKANGQEFKSNTDNAYFIVEVFAKQVTRKPLVEEYTGLWCGWCPRGYTGMEIIEETYGDKQVSACWHNNDEMAVTDYYPMSGMSFPSASVDRLAIIDPYYGSSGYNLGILNNVESEMKQAIVELNVKATVSEDKTTLNVTSESTFLSDYENANYQVGYLLTCSNLMDPTWAQVNYFGSATYVPDPEVYAGTDLYEWTKKPYSIRGLVFNDVVVNINGYLGVANSLPNNINAFTTYTHDFTYRIGANNLINDIKNLKVIAFVVNKKTTFIENAAQFSLSGYDAVETVAADKEVVSTQYFDLSGRRVLNPAQGIYVKTQKYSDGTVKSEKVVL